MINFKDKTSSDLLREERLILFLSEIDEEEAYRQGKEVRLDDGTIAGLYIKDGYGVYSAYATQSRGNYSQAFKTAMVLARLNPDKPIETLFCYMDMICEEKFDDKNFIVDRKIIVKIMRNVIDGLYEVTPETRKFFWVGIYTKIGKKDKVINDVLYRGKASIIMAYNNKTVFGDNFVKVENALATLIELGNEYNTFLTLKDISDLSGVSLRTVKRLSFMFKDDIDAYNMSVFNVSTYNEFLKVISINKITSSIRNFITEVEVKLSQRKVAVKSGLHFNTVNNLWYEDDVQESLQEYNDWLTNLNKLPILTVQHS